MLKTVNQRETERAEIDALTRLGWIHTDLLDAVAHGACNVGVDIIFGTFQIENDF